MKKMLTAVLLVWGLAVDVGAQVADFTPPTPLIGALLHNDAAEARRLLERGADPNEGRIIGFAPIVLAIQRQNLDLLRLMIAKGADLNVRDRSGSTALMWAAANEFGSATVVEEVLRLGGDPLTLNNVGESALDWALRRGNTAAVAALRRAGASDALRVRASVEDSCAEALA